MISYLKTMTELMYTVQQIDDPLPVAALSHAFDTVVTNLELATQNLRERYFRSFEFHDSFLLSLFGNP